ncbi:MAG: DUF5671 domain-containing protein [bacterium]
MEEKNKSAHGSGPLDAFLNLLSLITLGWMSISIGAVLFQIINKFFVPITYPGETLALQGALKGGLASSIVVVPVFLLVAWVLAKKYASEDLSPKSGIHRWLTYLMLLISSLVIIGSLVGLLVKFLNGDYATGVMLKILVVLIIAAGIFSYYFYDLRRKNHLHKDIVARGFWFGVLAIAIIVIIGGLVISDSPKKVRLMNEDSLNVQKLESFNMAIINYYGSNKKLPENLSGLYFSNFVDKNGQSSFGYTLKSENEYELCADFNYPAADSNVKIPNASYDDIYYHDAGHQCFTKKVDLTQLNSIQQFNIPPEAIKATAQPTN